METAPTRANAVECGNCSGITMDPDAEECSDCGADDYLLPVVVTECELKGDCGSDDHHWGIGKHVSEPS